MKTKTTIEKQVEGYYQLDINNLNVKLWCAIRNNDIKTSEEWSQIINSALVVDPDGWDRSDFQYSWFEEKITLDEYKNRVSKSTIKRNEK